MLGNTPSLWTGNDYKVLLYQNSGIGVMEILGSSPLCRERE
jgi:hypothetical protein